MHITEAAANLGIKEFATADVPQSPPPLLGCLQDHEKKKEHREELILTSTHETVLGVSKQLILRPFLSQNWDTSGL